MTIFTIENETNNITAHANAKEAAAVNHAQRFRNQAGLAKLASEWPASRLRAIWNTLPGATPVRKFKDRATAVSRIWSAIQGLGDAVPSTLGSCEEAVAYIAEPPTGDSLVAAQTPVVLTETAVVGYKTRPAKKPPVRRGSPLHGSKTEAILSLMKAPGGSSLKVIMAATQWQAHSVRGFISMRRKNMGLAVASTRREDGERTYSIDA